MISENGDSEISASTQPIASLFFKMRVRIPIFAILKIKFLTGIVLEIVQNAIFPCTFLMGSFSVKNSKRKTVRSQLLLNQLPHSFFLNAC